MITNRSHQGTRTRITAANAGTHLGRLAAVLTAVTCGLLASVAAVPAAFARMIPPPGGQYGPAPLTPVAAVPGAFGRLIPPPGGPYGTTPLTHVTTSHLVTTAGMAGWQIALIALGAALIAACGAVVLDRARSARRSPSVTAA